MREIWQTSLPISNLQTTQFMLKNKDIVVKYS